MSVKSVLATELGKFYKINRAIQRKKEAMEEKDKKSKQYRWLQNQKFLHCITKQTSKYIIFVSTI